jgi:hypothetical protein
MQQLSMTDAFMLAAETDKQKLQVASVSILAPPANNRQRLTRKRLRDHIAKRIDLAPVLRRELMHVPLGLGLPVLGRRRRHRFGLSHPRNEVGRACRRRRAC